MKKHVFNSVLPLLALGSVSIVAAERSGEKPAPIVDPYQAEHFSCQGRPDGRLHNNPNESFGYNGFRIVADLNFDDREDLILSTSGEDDGGCGNAGCAVKVFLLQADKTYSSFGLFLHPRASASKKVRRGRGVLATYQRLGGGEGTVDSCYVTARSAMAIAPVMLRQASSKDEDVYHRWFNGRFSLHAEYARCLSGQLQWTDSYE